jgi:hypothetical protein
VRPFGENHRNVPVGSEAETRRRGFPSRHDRRHAG